MSDIENYMDEIIEKINSFDNYEEFSNYMDKNIDEVIKEIDKNKQ